MKHDILYQGVANNNWKSAWHDAAHILLLNLSESTCTMAHNLQTKSGATCADSPVVLSIFASDNFCFSRAHRATMINSHPERSRALPMNVPHTFTFLPAAAALQNCIASQSTHGFSNLQSFSTQEDLCDEIGELSWVYFPL